MNLITQTPIRVSVFLEPDTIGARTCGLSRARVDALVLSYSYTHTRQQTYLTSALISPKENSEYNIYLFMVKNIFFFCLFTHPRCSFYALFGRCWHEFSVHKHFGHTATKNSFTLRFFHFVVVSVKRFNSECLLLICHRIFMAVSGTCFVFLQSYPLYLCNQTPICVTV